jgi:type II pantothenate kinase
MLNGPAHRLAVMLVDNAGADVVLGMIPLARELLRRGTSVIISANSNPALNDITHDELVPLIDRAGEIDAVMRDAWVSGQLRLVPSGNGSPLIDLTQISDELAEASRDADLLVIEGMGRALETNYHTRFTCESLKLAMVKEQHIAEVLGGGLYDVVCRYEAPISGAAVNAEPGAARSTIT